MSEREDIIFGVNTVSEALEVYPDRIHKLILTEGTRHSRLNDLLSRARNAGVPVVFQPRHALDRQTDRGRHQGVVAIVAPVRYANHLEIIAEVNAAGRIPLLVVLDHIQDPHNLGAVARSAEALGANALIIPRHRSASPGGAAEKAAAGALRHLPLCRVANLARTLEELKSEGVWILGTAGGEGVDVSGIDLTVPLAVVIGGEEKGMRPVIRSVCDMIASIPMSGLTSSLNASVAAGIVLYEIGRQRGRDRS
jgi:23S rRNA (guanosine2251-2'-O)-methyltransferase